MPIIVDRERQISYLMRKFGLTREEAEGVLNMDCGSVDAEKLREKAPLIVEEMKKDPDPIILSALLMLAGFAGLALADWILKRLSKKRKMEEREEWLV